MPKAQMRTSQLSRDLLLSLGALIVSVASIMSLNLYAQTATASPSPADIIQALQSRQFEEALRLSQLDLKKYPEDKRLWTLRGMALSGKGSKIGRAHV